MKYLLFPGLFVYAPVIQFNSRPKKSPYRQDFFPVVHKPETTADAHRRLSAASGNARTRRRGDTGQGDSGIERQNPYRVTPVPLSASVSKAVSSATPAQRFCSSNLGAIRGSLSKISTVFEWDSKFSTDIIPVVWIISTRALLKLHNSSPPVWISRFNRLIYIIFCQPALRFP